jgi:hypothetical protein
LPYFFGCLGFLLPLHYTEKGIKTEIDATAYGLFNCVTEMENWVRVEKKPSGDSLIMGNRAKTMNRATSVLKNWVVANNE